MQEFVPAGFVLVIVLRHVVRPARHARTSCPPFRGCPRFGGRDSHLRKENSIPKCGDWLERPGSTESYAPVCLLRSQTEPFLEAQGRRAFQCRKGEEAYKSRRPSMAFSMVTSSAYSRSAPTGIPTPIRVTRTPSGFSSLEM